MASVEAVFTLIDNVSSKLENIERRAQAAEKALNDLGKKVDSLGGVLKALGGDIEVKFTIDDSQADKVIRSMNRRINNLNKKAITVVAGGTAARPAAGGGGGGGSGGGGGDGPSAAEFRGASDFVKAMALADRRRRNTRRPDEFIPRDVARRRSERGIFARVYGDVMPPVWPQANRIGRQMLNVAGAGDLRDRDFQRRLAERRQFVRDYGQVRTPNWRLQGPNLLGNVGNILPLAQRGSARYLPLAGRAVNAPGTAADPLFRSAKRIAQENEASYENRLRDQSAKRQRLADRDARFMGRGRTGARGGGGGALGLGGDLILGRTRKEWEDLPFFERISQTARRTFSREYNTRPPSVQNMLRTVDDRRGPFENWFRYRILRGGRGGLFGGASLGALLGATGLAGGGVGLLGGAAAALGGGGAIAGAGAGLLGTLGAVAAGMTTDDAFQRFRLAQENVKSANTPEELANAQAELAHATRQLSDAQKQLIVSGTRLGALWEAMTKPIESNVANIFSSFVRTFERVRPATEPVLRGFGQVGERIATGVEDYFEDPAAVERLNRALAPLPELSYQAARGVGRLAEVAQALLIASTPLGFFILEGVNKWLERIAETTRGDGVENWVNWFAEFKPLLAAVGSLGAAVADTFVRMAPTLVPFATRLVEMIELEVLPAVETLIQLIDESLGPQFLDTFSEALEAFIVLAPIAIDLLDFVLSGVELLLKGFNALPDPVQKGLGWIIVGGAAALFALSRLGAAFVLLMRGLAPWLALTRTAVPWLRAKTGAMTSLATATNAAATSFYRLSHAQRTAMASGLGMGAGAAGRAAAGATAATTVAGGLGGGAAGKAAKGGRFGRILGGAAGILGFSGGMKAGAMGGGRAAGMLIPGLNAVLAGWTAVELMDWMWGGNSTPEQVADQHQKIQQGLKDRGLTRGGMGGYSPIIQGSVQVGKAANARTSPLETLLKRENIRNSQVTAPVNFNAPININNGVEYDQFLADITESLRRSGVNTIHQEPITGG